MKPPTAAFWALQEMAKTPLGMPLLLQVCLVLGACMRPGNATTTPPTSTVNDGAQRLVASRSFKITLGPRETRTERTVPRDAEVQLMCLLSNSGLLGWYKENERLSANRLLILKAVQPRDAGVYSCQAQGSGTAHLTLKIGDSGIEPEPPAEDDIADFSKVEDEAEARLRIEPIDVDSVEEEAGTGVTSGNSTALKIVHLPNSGLPLFSQSHKPIDAVQRPLGGFVQLSCPALGNPLPSIAWLHNNAALNLSNDRVRVKMWTLFIDRLTPHDTGLYTCRICNKFGCISHNTDLTVSSVSPQSEKPVIVDNTPANQTVAVDGSAQFECRVSPQTPAQILWFKYKRSQAPMELSLNFTNSPYVVKLETSEDNPQLLRIERVRPENGGWYTCVVVNSAGQAMASAYLMVVEPKSTAWTKQKVSSPTSALKSSRIVEAKSSIIDTKTPVSVSRRPIVEVESEGNYDRDSVDSQTLDLDTVFATPVKSKYGKWSPKSNITSDSDADPELDGENKEPLDTGDGDEESPPKFKRADKLINSIHKPAGSSIQLLCPAIGNPIPNITWTRNNTEILRHIGKVVYKKWSMQMDDVIAEDSGAYKCSICNKLGCVEHTVKLMIKDRLRSRPIHSDKFPQNQTVLTNSSTHFECRVVSDLEPHIFWVKYMYKNDSIANLERLVVNTPQASPKDYVKLPGDPDKPHILSLENVTHADEGWYTCVAANMLGESMASAYLRVVDKLATREVYMLWRTHPIWMTVAAIVIVLLFLFGSIFIIYVLRKLKHEKLLKHRIETVHQWTKKVIIYKPASSEGNSCDLQMPVIKIEKQRTTFQASSLDPTQAFNEYEFPLDSNWEIPRTQLTLGSTLGEGAFGRVVMAEACGLPRTANNTSSIVAVKMVKEEHTDADMASLVREMEVMKMIGKHINIINLLGCCSQSGPLWVIVEFAPHGNLKDFLKKNRPLFVGSPTLQRNSSCLEDKPQLTEKNLISFAFQIARGMEYLASRRCIHRDLAARNVLVSDDYVMKIADFGLARDIQDTDYYRKNTNGRLPIKWMAPESLQEKFYDSQSDVWSYGVLLWEIMTYGEQPYPNIMSAEELYSYLITGQRMEKPPRCSLNIYMLMRQCWHFDSNVRPTFVEIVENLDKILQLANNSSNEEYLDVSMPMLETPPSSSDDESEPEIFQETSPLRYQYTYKFN